MLKLLRLSTRSDFPIQINPNENERSTGRTSRIKRVIDLPFHTDASPWPPGKVERAPAWLDCGGPRAGWRGSDCAGPHEDGSDAAAAAGGSGRCKDNIDTSHRSSSSPRPGPAPQSWPADLRIRTSHHPFQTPPLRACPLPPMTRRDRLRRSASYG